MKFTVEKRVLVKEEIEVDDRIYDDHTLEWQMADILLNGALKRIVDRDLDHEDSYVIEDAISRINEAFKKADACLVLFEQFKD